MKAISYIIIFFFVIFVVYMFQYIDEKNNHYHKQMCDHITRAAMLAMAGRQHGYNIDEMFSKLSNSDSSMDKTEKLNKIHENLISSAYAKKKYTNESDQKNEIERFSKQSFYKYCVHIH